MLVPLSWLKEFVDIKIPFKELAWKLTEAGLTVEKWEENPSADGGDIIFDPEVTPNRPDWMSVYGTAREVAAVTNSSLKEETPQRGVSSIRRLLNKESPEIRIKNDFKLCPRYTAIVTKDVKVKPAPEWMQKRLKSVGLRPINNLVDITNYVMWELGNPLHVFDLDKIRGKQMIMELSKGGEEFKSLDGINYRLPEGAIIFKDLGRVIDLCGIKGGENTAVSTETKNILIHVPIYEPTHIRRTSQALNLRSDASTIFERGADPGGTIRTVERAAQLVLDLAGGKMEGKAIDLMASPFTSWTVELRHERLESVLGIRIDPKKVADILERLGLHTSGSYTVTVPTFRNDLSIEEDLIEEVGRIYGYNNFPKTLPEGAVPTTKVAYSRDFDLEYRIKESLKGAGYSEIYTYSFVSEKQLIALGLDPTKTLRVDNPISAEFEYFRPHLLGNILEAVKTNLPNFETVRLFELGKEYTGENLDKAGEDYSLAAGLSGEKFFEAKGEVSRLLSQLNIPYQIIPGEIVFGDHWLHPGRKAIIVTGKTYLGFIAQIHPSVLSRFGIKRPVTAWELKYDALEKLVGSEKKYQPVPKYPPVVEDLALIIPEKVLYAQVVAIIKGASKLVNSLELIDIHDQTKTLRVTYLDPARNLTGREIAQVRKKILTSLKARLKVAEKG